MTHAHPKLKPIVIAALLLIVLIFRLSPMIKSTAPAGYPRLTVEHAGELVQAWYDKTQPGRNPGEKNPLRELTTDEIWSRMGVQVFKVTEGVHMFDSFLIRDGRVEPMGIAFGGYGVDALAVTDLDGNGQPELLFTYSWGSGLHRAHLAVYSPALPKNGMLAADLALMNGDLSLAKQDDRRVAVLGGLFNQKPVQIGYAQLGGENGQPALTLRLDPNLPAAILANMIH
jgi:hypothetical protein